MPTIREYMQNSKDAEKIKIFLEWEKSDKHDPISQIIWEGMLDQIPEEYHDREVAEIGQSLGEAEKGITAYYIQLKRKQKKQETVTVELDKELIDKLEEMSKETGMSMSELAGKILRHHTEMLSKEKKT